MVNTVMVNARAACVPHAHFREIFRALGRFLRFKTSVKYKRIFEINQSLDCGRTPLAAIIIVYQ